jgi:TM2 domain-containing membrane protein YozV
MAKFCSNCGAPLEDGQEVCLKCGHITNKNFGDQFKDFVAPKQGKSRITAGLLGIFLGGLGVHSFYLGNTSKGIIQLVLSICTFGIAGIWGFIEGILILTGSTNTDADGNPLV